MKHLAGSIAKLSQGREREDAPVADYPGGNVNLIDSVSRDR